MKKVKFGKRIVSIFLAVLMAVTGLVPAFNAFADDNNGSIENRDKIQLFYKDTDTAVPNWIDETAAEKQEFIQYMVEGEELKLTYKLIEGTVMPDNGYVKWYSETPTLVDVTQDGVVKAFDSSKGAVIHTWIDNEVKTIPLVGSIMATVLEKALFNDKVNVDTMDTEAIINVVEGAFGSESILAKWIDSYKGELIDSLRYYLDNINSNIHVTLYSADGTKLADDYVRICVTRNEEWYAKFLPNGTHITNKSQINTTVAVGSKVQLYAVTTPVRLKYGVVYSVKSSSIFQTGKAVATVDDSGLVTFKNKGTVTIIVSPDTEQVIQGILEFINYFYKLENTGTIDSKKIADILIKYIGIDIDRTVLAGLIDACIAIKDIAGDAADPVQLTATAVQILSNIIMKFAYNDTITFNVVDSSPLTDFRIEGVNPDNPEETEKSIRSVQEGSQIQLKITDIKPETADTSDITWTSSDPSVASVDPITGTVTGRDAGGSLGQFSRNTCEITATSAANNVSRTVTITVTGKTGQYISDAEIIGPDTLEAPAQADYSFSLYPTRVAESKNLYIEWGIQTGEDEEGNPTYLWATDETPANDGIGQIDSKGHYETVTGGICTIALHAKTGYPILDDNFYEISSCIKTLEVTNGIPIENIEIKATDVIKSDTYGSKLITAEPVVIGDNTYQYYTVSKNIASMYQNSGAVVKAEVYPETASNKNLRWVIDNDNYKADPQDNTHTANITQATARTKADTFNVYAESEDGKVKSNVITICLTRNFANSNVINEDSIDVTNGKTADATHTMKFDGSWTGEAYACYKCNWYSSDESVFTVKNKGNENSDAVLTGVDVGTATLYCVSADGGIVDSCEVTVFPDKEYLQSIVKLCNKTVVKKTKGNNDLYQEYMQALDLAYYVLYDDTMTSQSTCDTYADDLLYAFYRVGGFVGLADINILGTGKTQLESDYVTVPVGLTERYDKCSYDFDYEITPKTAMYSRVIWKSSNPDAISVDNNGVCRPTSNDPCSALITCTVKDFMGNEVSDSAYVAFAWKAATGVTLNETELTGDKSGKIGETYQLTATVQPTGTVAFAASCTDVHWESSDESIATVDENGLITFNDGGDCVITCITNDGGHKAECKVNVVTNYTGLQLLIQQYTDLGLSEINYYPDSWEVYQKTMNAAKDMVAQGGYSQKEVNQMRDDLENAYKNLRKYDYIQKVELYLDGEQTAEFYQFDVSIFKDGIRYKDAVLDLNVRLYPNNASYKSVEWTSSTPDIAVTNDGKCSPTSNNPCYGQITCTVTDHFGNAFSDNVWVSFAYTPVAEVRISETNISGVIGNTHQLTATVKSSGVLNPSIKEFFWMSEDESVATVDETGLVTFVSAGSTKIKAVSYDGGVTGECMVSSGGDRNKLKLAIDKYKDTDYTDYEYDYGIAFKDALDEALKILTDDTCSQQRIDEATVYLETTHNALAAHPYIKTESLTVAWNTVKRSLTNKETARESGTISDNDSVSINLSNDYSNYNNYNDITLTATPAPADAMYKSIVWHVDSSNHMDVDSKVTGNQIKLTPSKQSNGAWAVLTVTLTDHYDRTTVRTVTVAMSDNVCTGFDITDSSANIYATDKPSQINYTISGSPEFANIKWTSSNEAAVTVNENGVITPIEKGTATITGKTLDGGYTDSITYTVLTDFSVLAEKQATYTKLIDDVRDSYTYTEQSLNALAEVASEAKVMIDEDRATQAEVNAMIERLDNARNSLVEYVATKGVHITFDEQTNVTEVNEGFIRYSAVGLNGKTIQLKAVEEPLQSVYTSCEWKSSNENITVDENGLVQNSTNIQTLNNAAKITCTLTNALGDSYSASVYVTFTRTGVTGISFADEKVMGAPSNTVTLTPVVTPNSAGVKDCAYTSSNPEIATVDENGVVTFISQGEATIIATTIDGGYSATIQAFTTWDTSALKSAIEGANALNKSADYTAYEYAYGMAYKNAYDKAVEVYDNPYSSQQEIDNACTALVESMSVLQDHLFVKPSPAIKQGDTAVTDGAMLFVDENNQVILDYVMNENAMYKSAAWSTENENGAEVTQNGESLVITKTTEDTATLTVKVITIDDWDREEVKSVNIKVIDKLIPATSIALTVNGNAVENSAVTLSSGGKYSSFPGATVGYITTPANANAVTDVTYTLTPSAALEKYAEINSKTGEITLTAQGKICIKASFKFTVKCTVKNEDGSTATASAEVTITKS